MEKFQESFDAFILFYFMTQIIAKKTIPRVKPVKVRAFQPGTQKSNQESFQITIRGLGKLNF